MRHIGSSNLSAAQVREADASRPSAGWPGSSRRRTSTRGSSGTPRTELIPACEELGLGLIPYFPLAERPPHRQVPPRRAGAPEGTRLSGSLEVADETWDRLEALEAFARAHGVGLLDVAIGGLAAQPAVASVIAGATTPEQVRANAAAGEWEPSAGELQALLSV